MLFRRSRSNWGLPWGLSGEESACHAGDSGLLPGSARSPGGGNGNPLQYSCLRNPMDRGVWWAKEHGVPKSWNPFQNTVLWQLRLNIRIWRKHIQSIILPDINHWSKRGEGKSCLKLNIPKTKIMASGPITSWEIDGETVQTVSDFSFMGSTISADGDCSHEIKDAYSLEGKLWPT